MFLVTVTSSSYVRFFYFYFLTLFGHYLLGTLDDCNALKLNMVFASTYEEKQSVVNDNGIFLTSQSVIFQSCTEMKIRGINLL